MKTGRRSKSDVTLRDESQRGVALTTREQKRIHFQTEVEMISEHIRFTHSLTIAMTLEKFTKRQYIVAINFA